MKARLVLCFFLIAFFLPSIPTQAEGPSVGSVTIRSCRILAGGHPDLNSYGAAGGESRLIIDNWNPAGCGFTDNAVMNLSRPTHVESVHLWYNWAAGESSLPYALSGSGRVLRNGQFRRGSCDPYQTAWCEATDMLGMNLAPGSYTFTTARRRVCQNSGSNGMGFIRVTARTGRAGPGAYPGQETIQPSQPATPELATGPATNLALGKPTQQSSTYSGDFPASNGVDGRKDDGSMFHTNNERNPWWQVDLQGNYALSYIMLYNRTGCCAERERTVQLLLSQNGSNWQRIYSHNGTDFRELRVEAGGRQARYVRVQLAEQNYFHLQEVEVYGVPAAGTAAQPFGTQPSQPATPELATGPATNLALGMPTQQSSTYSGDFPASSGVDGRKDDGSMFHTNNERNPWWQVDLEGNYALSYIMLYNRTGCCAERERTVQVLLSQNGSNWQRIYSHNGTDFRELRVEAGGRRARYVRVQLAEQNYFHLQEVEVYGAR
ncbi:MAG: discoidin domain-containing protein [Acidobacteriia bacterium]|nr:discoidin domain-containing protein [Terriglobia bacterium]